MYRKVNLAILKSCLGYSINQVSLFELTYLCLVLGTVNNKKYIFWGLYFVMCNLVVFNKYASHSDQLQLDSH